MIIVAFVSLLPFIVASETYHDTLRLKEDLFENKSYDVHVRPVIDQNKSVTVNVSSSIESFTYLDEHEGQLSTIVHLRMSWHDELLKWQPHLYNGVQKLVVSQNDIWKPDIILKNRLGEFEEFGSGVSNVVIYSSGCIVWEFVQIMHSHCALDFYSFPYDKQICNIILKSLTLEADNLLLFSGTRPEIHQTTFGSWSVQSVTSNIETNDYSIYTVKINLNRINRPYIISTVLPISLLVVLNLTTFFIPSRVGERMSYSVTLFLAFQIFLSLFDTQFPHGHDARLKDFLFIELYLSGISIILSIMSMRTGGRKDKIPDDFKRKVRTYRSFKTKLHSLLSPCLDSKYQTPENNPNNNSLTEKPKEDNRSQNQHSTETDMSSNTLSKSKEKKKVMHSDEHINIDNVETSEENESRRSKVVDTNQNTEKEMQYEKTDLSFNEVSIDWGDVSDTIDFMCFLVMLLPQLGLTYFYVLDAIRQL